MTEPTLDEEEREALAAFEAGELESALTEARKAALAEAAAASVTKDRRINIRLASRDLEALQRKALEEGIPYQTLIASILHKYASGHLKDVDP